MRSMTGFGQAEGENEHYRLAITLRAVNHRFLDISLRLREEVRSAEPALREALAASLKRGRIEAQVAVDRLAAQELEIQVDTETVRSVHEACRELADAGWIEPGVRFADLLRIPEVVHLRAKPLEWRSQDQDLLLSVLAEAVEQVVEARSTEGGQLQAVLLRRLEALEGVTAKLRERSEGMTRDMAEALRQRITDLMSGNVPDEDRLAQEIAVLVDRSDVSEELDRLSSHLEHFRSLMDGEGSIGKRLDFLGQEILRELNTVGSKCRDSEMTRQVLEGKAVCEQLREQVQNVE